MSTPSFGQRLKLETIRLHTQSQLHGKHHAPNVSLSGYTAWIKAQRDVHQRFATFPIQPKVDYVEALDTELFYLDMELYGQNIELDIEALPLCDYAMYLEDLPRHIMTCHWYNVIFAHLVGGNTFVAKSASHVLPPKWIETSDFFQPTDPETIVAMRSALDTLAGTWTETERDQCVAETGTAFKLGTRMHDLLG